MADSFGALVDFSSVVSFTDPVVATTLASVVRHRLAAAQYREFRLTSHVIVLVFDANDSAVVKRSLGQLDRDLLASHHGKLSWNIFDLDTDLKGFQSACMSLVERATGRGDHEELLFRLNADRLGAMMHIIDSLATVDLATHMRNQPAVRFVNGMPKTIEFEEYWVSLESLEQAFETPLQSDTFRFRLVTELLDMKVLRAIIEDWRGNRPISLNFHARNALTTEFASAAPTIVESRRKQMIFELSMSDLIDDRDQFVAAARKLSEFGFRVSLDGMIWPAVESISDAIPEIRFIKVPWNEAFKRAGVAERAAMRKTMDHYPSKTFVMSRCDDEDACNAGLSMGFNVLQGRGVKVPATIVPQAHRTPRPAGRARH
jgi:hypothetical protein